MSKPKNNALEEILKNKGFAEFIITAWGAIEQQLNDVFLREHNMSTQNLAYKKLLKLSFTDKLNHQLEIGILSPEEVAKVKAFKNERNKLFHDEGVFFPHLTDDKKQAIVDIAFESVAIIENLRINVFDQKNNSRWQSNNKN